MDYILSEDKYKGNIAQTGERDEGACDKGITP